jgi:hypothetical protein
MTKARIDYDKYYTGSFLTKALTSRIQIEGDILECCAGERDISTELEKLPNVSVISTDITDPSVENDTPTLDATDIRYWQFEGNNPDWVITNPPFNVAHDIIPLAYQTASRGVCMLLRLTYLEPCANRAEWLMGASDQLRVLIPVNPRPRFRTDTKGTDSVTVAWFVWDKQWSWRKLGVTSPFQFAPGWNFE